MTSKPPTQRVASQSGKRRKQQLSPQRSKKQKATGNIQEGVFEDGGHQVSGDRQGSSKNETDDKVCIEKNQAEIVGGELKECCEEGDGDEVGAKVSGDGQGASEEHNGGEELPKKDQAEIDDCGKLKKSGGDDGTDGEGSTVSNEEKIDEGERKASQGIDDSNELSDDGEHSVSCGYQ